MQRWTLHDPVAGDTFRLRANPRQMTTPVRPHRTTTAGSISGKIRALRPPTMPQAWNFVGRIRDVEDYDALLDWAKRPNRITITDHLGRVHSVIPVSFEPTAVEKAGGGNPWLFDYTFKALYMERIA